jgi:hypothetical protein
MFEKSREVERFSVGVRKKSWDRKMFARVGEYLKAREARKAQRREKEEQN